MRMRDPKYVPYGTGLIDMCVMVDAKIDGVVRKTRIDIWHLSACQRSASVKDSGMRMAIDNNFKDEKKIFGLDVPKTLEEFGLHDLAAKVVAAMIRETNG